MASYNSSDVTDMIRSKRVFLGTYCPPSSSCGGGGGSEGQTGPTGPPGADGKSVLNGVGPPTPAIGTVGDFYLDTSAYVLYGPKYSNYYQNWTDMAGSLYLGTPNIYNYAYLQSLPASNVVCNVNILPVSNLNVQFAAYDNRNVKPALVLTNTTTNTSSIVTLDLSTAYGLTAGTTYNLTYTCVSGNTLMDVRFQNYSSQGQQVIWTNNQWFISETLVGPTGPTGPTGPVAGTDTQVIFNQSGAAGATGAFTFNYTTGTLNVSSLAGTTMTGNLNMNTCNISNIGTAGFDVSDNGFIVLSGSYTTSITGGRKYYVFTTNAVIVSKIPYTVSYAAVGGGGGGAGNVGGGGGAGGLQTNDYGSFSSSLPFASQSNEITSPLPAGTYTITIGEGGLGSTGADGTNTIFALSGGSVLVNASGGGGDSRSGGCGSGGSGGIGELGVGTGSQGGNGGYGTDGLTPYTGGGGGGIGGDGGNYSGYDGGAGGVGLVYTPLNMTLGGGGGGGTFGGNTGAIGGVGGSGIGGSGNSTGGPEATAGVSNTGSGGGGGGGGGDGGSGVFIISHLLSGVVYAGTISINPLYDLQISSTTNIVLAPSTGGVTISGLTPAISDMTGFYNLVYNPTTGQLAYYTP